MASDSTNCLLRIKDARAVEVMNAYLAAPNNPDGRTPFDVQKERDVEQRPLNQCRTSPDW